MILERIPEKRAVNEVTEKGQFWMFVITGDISVKAKNEVKNMTQNAHF